jgi:hypothetical protein
LEKLERKVSEARAHHTVDRGVSTEKIEWILQWGIIFEERLVSHGVDVGTDVGLSTIISWIMKASSMDDG